MEETNNIEKTIKLPRIWEIDFVRGLLIFLMIMDHFFYDWAYLLRDFMGHSYPYPEWFINLSSFSVEYWNSPIRIGVRFAVLALFFIVCGISCNLSKNNLKRGIIILSLGILISIGSYIVGAIIHQEIGIIFGVLSTYGVSILIYWSSKKLFIHLSKNNQAWKYFALALGIIFVFIGVFIGFYNNPPYDSKLTWENFIPIIIGSRGYGLDWLGLFPAIGYLFIGGFIGELLYTTELRRKRIRFDEKMNKYTLPIIFCGKHCGIIYILHQPIVIAILVVILLCSGFYFKI